MTYIVAGKIKHNPFILVDKVEDFNPSQQPIDKTYTLKSNKKISLTLTGDALLMDLIKEYDEIFYKKEKKLTINSDVIDKLGDCLSKKCPKDQALSDVNSIYYIEKSNLYRYSLYFKNNIYDESKLLQIGNNEIIFCTDETSVRIERNYLDEITNNYDFAKYYLEKYYNVRYNNGDEKIPYAKMFVNEFNFIR